MEVIESFIILAETLPHMIWRALPHGGYDYFNRQWYEYTGLSKEESKGYGWTTALHPQDYEQTLQSWKQACQTGKLYETECRFRSKEGLYRWFLAKAQPAYNAEGESICWWGSYTDIEQRKSAELVLLRKNQQLQKMNERLESFVHIAAHDLKSPVNNLQMLLETAKHTSEKEKVFAMLEASVNRIQETLSSIETLLRWQEEGKVEPVKMNFEDIFQRVKDLLPSLEQQEVSIEVDFSGATQILYIEPYLFSMMKNLISNAIKYRCPQRDCRVYLKTEKQAEGVLLTISDNGIGIDLEKHGRQLFQSFKRISDQQGGLGLGLYLIKKMTEHNGGKIEVESKLNEGTTFKLHLRAYKQEDRDQLNDA